ATNACLNALERAPRRVLPQDVAAPVTADTPSSDAKSSPPWSPETPWLQPYPDDLLEEAAPTASEPHAVYAARENIELAFLAALPHLPPRQRAILILSDVLEWSAKEIADMLELSVASVNSALQRAHQTVGRRVPARHAPAAPIATEERAALKTFMEAWETGDPSRLTAM